MLQQKINYRIISISFLALVILFSCKKLAKEEIGITINAIVPSDGTPIPGVQYRIVELKSKKGLLADDKETGRVMEGRTDGSGNAIIVFKPKKNMDYSYMIYFDYSEVELPAGDWTFIYPPTYKNVTRQFMTEENSFDIRALPKMQVQINFKNLHCFDQEDIFRYKKINSDESPNATFLTSTPWLEGPSLNGCVDFTGPYSERLGGHYIFKWEAVRGGELTSGIDTFLVAPGVNDQINMFW